MAIRFQMAIVLRIKDPLKCPINNKPVFISEIVDFENRILLLVL